MARQTPVLVLLMAVIFSFCLSSVQSFSFEDLEAKKDEKKQEKLEKWCKFPGLEFLCPEEPDSPDISASVSVSDDGRRLRA